MGDKIISNVFGTLGAVCWSVQLTPQIILNYRRHSAEGLSSGFMLFWAWAGIPLGVYNIVNNFNVALRIQPQILTTLSLITWAQCYYYQRGWSVRKVAALLVPAACFMGGVEVALIFAVKIGLKNGTTWPLTLMAVLTAVLLCCGVLEQYLAIWKNKSVYGISFLFCGIDAMGDITSIVSVCFEPKLRILALVMYGAELVLWVGVFALGFYFKWIPLLHKKTRKLRQKREGETTENAGQTQTHGVSLRELPSSTSVFRTASSEADLRSRGHIDRAENAD